jgi:hypothetical protein
MKKEMTPNGRLEELGLKYMTDKSSLLHDYLNQYEILFPKPESVLKMAEIGLQRGRKWRNEELLLPSLRMWGDFFPNAKLYGFDIKKYNPVNDRMFIMQGDQGDLSSVKAFSDLIGDNLDFIIDDGSHDPIHQLHSFVFMFDKLKSGGIYIIEDCNAVVQGKYKKECQIHNLMQPYLFKFNHIWIESKSAGELSSLAIFKP